MGKIELLIPFGPNCFDKDGMCPHYEAKDAKKGLILKSFCHFLKKDDVKLNDKIKICEERR